MDVDSRMTTESDSDSDATTAAAALGRATSAHGSSSSAAPPLWRATLQHRPPRLAALGSVLLALQLMSTVMMCYQTSGAGLLHLASLLHQELHM